ncbi:MAG: MraY family glycosyltransferase [Verrucomicrobia bacterium]|nr:MraY family glycosyltransferase [Verrucomicrobiota bacterium]
MSFPFNVYLLAFVSAALTTALTLPLWRAWCRRTGLVDDPGHRKIHHTPVPLAGGLAVLTGLIVPLLGGALVLGLKLATFPSADFALSHGLERRGVELAAILLGAVGMTFLGWLDDKHELRPALKFIGQFLIALVVAAAGVRVTLFVPSVVFSYAVTIFWILTVTNAFNFMDNMNGLCAGLGAIGAWYFGVLAAVDGQYLVALLALLTCGALLGFLPFNFPKATTFLGDAGSHLTGYLLAVLAILPHFYTPENPRTLAVLTPLLILAVPLGDLTWVVILRFSHRLVRRGMSNHRAVLIIWLIAVALGALALI